MRNVRVLASSQRPCIFGSSVCARSWGWGLGVGLGVGGGWAGVSSTRRARRSLRRRSWLALWALVLAFWASSATGVSWALPMPHFSRVSHWLGSVYQSAMGVWDGRSHAVSAASTRARSGALGRAAGTAPGELPAYQVKTLAYTPSRTGAFSRG